MKKVIFIIIFIITINYTFGQSIVWEILNLGYSFGLTKDENGNTWNDYNGKSYGGLSFGSELRIKLLNNQLSPGLQFSFSGWNRCDPEGSIVAHQFVFSYMALCDYNFLNIHSKIIPFAGVGAGISRVRYDLKVNDIDSPEGWISHFAFSPRIGIEYKRVRLALEYKYLGNRNNYFNFRVGFIIGQ